MNLSTERGNALVDAYSLVRRSGFLQTSLGRRLFKSAYFLYKRYFEDDLRDLVLSHPALVSGGNVLDIGANIGYTAAVLARAAEPGRKVFAFEPEIQTSSFCKRPRSDLSSRAKSYRCNVPWAPKTASSIFDEFGHHADHRVMTANFRSGHPKTAAASVPLVSIDSFLESHTAKVSFIKIDVQGYELAVCQGMQNTLQQNPDIAIVLEFMPS